MTELTPVPPAKSLQEIKQGIIDGVASANANLTDDAKKVAVFLDADQLVTTPPVEGTRYAVYKLTNGQAQPLGSDFNEIKQNGNEIQVGIYQHDSVSSIPGQEPEWDSVTIDKSTYGTETPTHLVFKLTPLPTPAVSGGKRKRTHRKRHGKLRKTRRRHRRPAH